MRHSALYILSVAGLAALSTGCGTDAFLAVENPAPSNNNTPPDEQLPGVITHVFENFDNQRNVSAVTGQAELDVNQGILTLPSESIPRIDGYGTDMIRGRVERNGLVEAEQIVVAEMGSLEASDAVEMRAIDTVRVIGDIRAGRGGVTLIGGRGVYVEGNIDSLGPVRILVQAADGEIEVSGRISVRASSDHLEATPPHVELLGRGSVRVSGGIESSADAGRMGGDVRVQVYGPIKVYGATAHITTHAEGDGAPGTIRLRSEGSVNLGDGARVGRPDISAVDLDLLLGGHVEIQGTVIRLEDGATIEAGDGVQKGGAVFLSAREAIALDTGSTVRSGNGEEGGSLFLKAQRVGIGQGSALTAGVGGEHGALFEIDAVERLDIVSDAMVRGGHTACGPGGTVSIAVAGSVRVRDGATLRGGDGAVGFGTRGCDDTGAGGDVRIQAHSVDAPEGVLAAGRGFPDGVVEVTLDESLEVPPPNLSVGTTGAVISKIFDRGVHALGTVPVLVSAEMDTPEGTSVNIELCGDAEAIGPFTRCADAADPEALVELADAQYLRYRLRLVGRVFDAPVLDYFELDLAP